MACSMLPSNLVKAHISHRWRTVSRLFNSYTLVSAKLAALPCYSLPYCFAGVGIEKLSRAIFLNFLVLGILSGNKVAPIRNECLAITYIFTVRGL